MSKTQFHSECTRVLSEIRRNATFLTVHHYLNNFGELSDFSCCFHVNYLNAIRRAKDLLEAYEPKTEDCIGKLYSVDHLRTARLELIESYGMTMEGNNPLATSAHAYDEIVDPSDGQVIPGIKLHRDQDILHIYGFGLHKRVLLPGNYPPDNRYLKTMAKDALRNMSPLGRFVQFRLEPGRFRKLVVEGLTIKEQDVIRESHRRLMKSDFGK